MITDLYQDSIEVNFPLFKVDKALTMIRGSYKKLKGANKARLLFTDARRFDKA